MKFTKLGHRREPQRPRKINSIILSIHLKHVLREYLVFTFGRSKNIIES